MPTIEFVRARVIDRILNYASEQKPHSFVDEKTSLVEDLGFQSIDAINLVLELDKEFGIEIEIEQLVDVLTLGDVVNLVLRKLAISPMLKDSTGT